MKNIKPVPVIISVILSAAVLFGGWFAYHSFAMENPLKAAIEEIDGVTHVHAVEIKGSNVKVELSLTNEAELRSIWAHIHEQGASMIKDRKLELRIRNHSSDELDAWWSRALFDVAQAMEQHQYGDIPKKLQDRIEPSSHLEVNCEMDDDNVYVRINQGEHVKFIVLPRVAAQFGVWPNE